MDLTFPAGRGSGGTIDDGGKIVADRTLTQVDLDEVFNTLDPPTRRSLEHLLTRGSASVDGRGDDVGRALEYLDPALSTTSRLFSEASRDTPNLRASLTQQRAAGDGAERARHRAGGPGRRPEHHHPRAGQPEGARWPSRWGCCRRYCARPTRRS